MKVIQQALTDCGLPACAVQGIEDPDRVLVNGPLRLDRYVDMLIPRGGAGLHKLCREQSIIPVISGSIGVCHIYADDTIDFEQAMPGIEMPKYSVTASVIRWKRYRRTFPAAPEHHMHALGVTLHAADNARPYLEGG